MSEEWVKVESVDEVAISTLIRLGPIDCCGRTYEAIVLRKTEVDRVTDPFGRVNFRQVTGYVLSNYCCAYARGFPAGVALDEYVAAQRVYRYAPPPERVEDEVAKKLETVR